MGARELETAAYGFDRLVDEIVYSHEIGVRKPDPRAFAIACARLQVRPGDCLFVDDFARNIEAARAAGMRAHLFEDNAGDGRTDHRASGPYSFGLTFDMFRHRNRRRVHIPWTLS